MIRLGMFDPGDFEKGSQALVACFQTIEHVEDPKALCEAARELLKPGGAIYLVGHDRDSLVNRLLGNSSAPGLEVSHRSFITPSNSNAKPSVPNDFTNGSRLAKNGAMHTPYASVSPAHTITSIG